MGSSQRSNSQRAVWCLEISLFCQRRNKMQPRLKLLSTQFSTVLKTQRNGVVGFHRINRAQQNKSLQRRNKVGWWRCQSHSPPLNSIVSQCNSTPAPLTGSASTASTLPTTSAAKKSTPRSIALAAPGQPSMTRSPTHPSQPPPPTC